jgi:hypothetical protein
MRRRLRWVISAALLLAAIAGTYLGIMVTSPGGHASNPPATAALLTVVACPTSYSMEGSRTTQYPAAAPMSLGAGQDGKFALYSDKYRSLQPVLGPQGWNCSVLVAVDGGLSVTIFPPGQSARGPNLITAYSEPACVGCIYGEVCPLVPYATQIFDYPYLPCTSSPVPGEVVTWLAGPRTYEKSGADIIGFTDPPGVHGYGAGSGGHYQARGILRFSWSTTGSTGMSVITCTVAPAYESACPVILGLAAKQMWNGYSQ